VAKGKKNGKPKGNRKNIVKNLKQIAKNDEVINKLKGNETHTNI
jgi:hypothetical protein